MSEQIASVFGPAGLLKRAFPNYLPRAGQIEMALEVEDAALNGGRLVIEAPTGTGKSFAYLAGLIPFAVKGERVVVVTGTIVLQQQLIEKDLPLLARLLPEPFKFAIAKGLTNYLCKNEFEDWAGEVGMIGVKDLDLASQWEVIRDWERSTQSGDLAELPFELHPKVRLKVATTSDECLGQKCPHKEGCFGLKARERYKKADVVVANYSLFFVDLSVKAGDPEAGPLPPYKHLVFDEAHDAASIAREFFGFRISPFVVRRATRLLGGDTKLGIPDPEQKDLRVRIERLAGDLFDEAKEFAERREYMGRIEGPGAFDPTRLNAALMEATRVYGELSGGSAAAGQVALASGMIRLSAIRTQLEFAATNHDPQKFVYFIEREPIAIAMQPIVVGPMLKKHLFDSDSVKSITMASATLASGTRDDKFEFFETEIGCEGAHEVQVDSPFDFASNVLLYLPKPMHDPNHEDFPDEVGEVAWQLAQAAGGRMLGLFTSYRILKHVRQTLERRGLPWKLLVHGDAPRAQLIAEFKRDEHSVLLGTSSFWQGVDVPGPALSAVLIDKIPFPHATDPIMGAISAINRNWFSERALPLATIAIRQGFGRLVRTATDRGVVAICDPRIRTKGYGKKITKSLPEGIRSCSDIADVRAFLAGLSGEDVHDERSGVDRGSGSLGRPGSRV